MERTNRLDKVYQEKFRRIPNHLLEALKNENNVNITEELLAQQPHLYKLLLIKNISKVYPKVFKARQKLYGDGKVHIENLNITNSRTSRYTEGKIYIGGKPLSSGAKDSMIFFDNEFNYQKEIMRKLSHEISHIILGKEINNSQHITELINNIISPSRNSAEGRGLSLIGGIADENGTKFYKERGGVGEQAAEDTVELINMYLLGPQHLKKSLELMRDMSDERLDRYNLLRLDNDGIIYIFNKIKSGVDEWLNQ